MSTMRNRARSAVAHVILKAPAKVNLSLRVTGRRTDGYHEIDSLFVPVTLYDEVTVRIRSSPGRVRVSCDDPAVPTDSRNLAARAVEAYYHERPGRPAVDIAIHKRIPAGAGLGGGSSDAAAVLRALARLEGCDERSADLVARAAKVGADVPFFLWSRPARVRGIGERVEPLTDCPSLWLAIAWPALVVPTRWAYDALDAASTSRGDASAMPSPSVGDRSVGEFHNDFEPIVGARFPLILRLKERVTELGARGAGLSGSGSAVFGVFPDRNGAEVAARVLHGEGVWSVAVGTLEGPPEPEVRA